MFDPEFTRGTDKYFIRTKDIVAANGDVRVTYALFMRVPVIFAPRIMLDWLDRVAEQRGVEMSVATPFEEGERVGGGEPLAFISGSLVDLVDLETHILQRLGPPCVAAFNAYRMCCDLPQVAFLAMDARHCAGAEMAAMMAYAAGVGSRAAQRDAGAVGFTGNATDATARYFGNEEGLGTMPHALIGYAGSTVRAAEMFHATFPDERMTVLVDYYGHEVTDALAVASRFPELAKSRTAFGSSRHPWRTLRRGARSRGILCGDRTPCAGGDSSIPHRGRAALAGRHRGIGVGDLVPARKARRGRLRRGQDRRQLGFNPAKCAVMAIAKAPIDVVGTGSYLPDSWEDTYATADIIEYDGRASVKVGREFLLRRRKAKRINGNGGAGA